MEKKAHSPAEFAGLFGKERSWAYRLVKAGKIKVIEDLGRMMIPASEVVRIEAQFARFHSADKPAQKNAEATPRPSKSSEWQKWVDSRRGKPQKKMDKQRSGSSAHVKRLRKGGGGKF